MLESVKVSKDLEAVFEKTQASVKKYFKGLSRDVRRGTIMISGDRYLLVRAASLSVDFFETVKDLYRDKSEEEAIGVASNLLFDIAHAIGKADARDFHKRMKLKDPVEKLSAGPIHFAHAGWAFVDISPESDPTPDENYYLLYDHPFSFEAAAWMKARKKSKYPVCIMNAGYSSGWCEESFGVTLVASEIMCKARGDKVCRFIMAHPSRIEGYIKRYIQGKGNVTGKVKNYEIPSFFHRKQVEATLKQSVEERTVELMRVNDELKRSFNERVHMEEELRKSRELYQTLAETAEDYFFIVNRDMTVQYINNYGVRALSSTQGDIVGHHLSIVFPPHAYRNFENALERVIKTGMPHSTETEVEFPTRHIWLHTHWVPLKDSKGEVFAVVGLSRDFTDRKNLEDEVRQSLKIKSDFMATMSHELRTPLNSIIGCADLVLNDSTLNLSDKRRHNLKSVLASAGELLTIINNILNMARIEAGKVPINLERFSLPELIGTNVESCRGIALHKAIEMIVEVKDDLPKLYTDKEKVGHIITNLLSNAIKFTEGGRVNINAFMMPGKPDRVVISVRDTGIGIPAERRVEIFERFKQIDASTTRRYGGIGLGLAIVKSYVDLLGGSVEVESEIGKGSTFTIQIPTVLSKGVGEGGIRK